MYSYIIMLKWHIGAADDDASSGGGGGISFD